MIKKWMPQYQGKPMPPDEIDICLSAVELV